MPYFWSFLTPHQQLFFDPIKKNFFRLTQKKNKNYHTLNLILLDPSQKKIGPPKIIYKNKKKIVHLFTKLFGWPPPPPKFFLLKKKKLFTHTFYWTPHKKNFLTSDQNIWKSLMVILLLSATVKRFSVYRMGDFFKAKKTFLQTFCNRIFFFQTNILLPQYLHFPT